MQTYNNLNKCGGKEMVLRTIKTAVVLVVGLFLITLWMGTVQAHAQMAPDTDDGFYTVASNGSTVWEDEFSLTGSKPWLYIETPLASVVSGLAMSWWQDRPQTITPELAFDGGVASGQIWLALDDATWDSIKAVGTWDVSAYYSVATTDFGTPPQISNLAGDATFTVTPEPVSSVLFLIGGAGLVARRFRK